MMFFFSDFQGVFYFSIWAVAEATFDDQSSRATEPAEEEGWSEDTLLPQRVCREDSNLYCWWVSEIELERAREREEGRRRGREREEKKRGGGSLWFTNDPSNFAAVVAQCCMASTNRRWPSAINRLRTATSTLITADVPPYTYWDH